MLSYIAPYYGGKVTLAKKIVPLLKHSYIYVEPFCGMCTILLNKKPSPIEICNDSDGKIYTMLRVLQDKEKFEEVNRLLALSLPDSRMFAYAKSILSKKPEFTPLYAWAVIYVLRLGAGHLKKKVGFFLLRDNGRFPLLDQKIFERLKRVHFCNLDYKELIQKVDNTRNKKAKSILFYLDPPYEKRDTSAYIDKVELNEFIEVVSNIKGNWVVSNDFLPELCDIAKVVLLEKRIYMSNKWKTECLYLSYEPEVDPEKLGWEIIKK